MPGKRISRKPQMAGEETWYLVQYEDTADIFRVLNEREVKPLDADDDDKMYEGENVMGYWAAEKKFYPAEIISISDDKNKLLKEKRNIEASLKKTPLGSIGKENVKDPDRGTKRKSKEDQDKKEAATDSNKSKKRSGDQEKACKEAAKRKREEEKSEAAKRERAAINAKKAQATRRLEVTTALMQRAPLTQMCTSDQPSTSSQTPKNCTPQPTRTTQKQISSTPTTTVPQTTPNSCSSSTSCTSRNKSSVPARKQIMSCQADIDSDCYDDDSDDDNAPSITTLCEKVECRALVLQNMRRKARIERLKRRLNVAVQAKSPSNITNGKPAAGLVDADLAAEYKMKEFYDGSGVYWYSAQRSVCSFSETWQKYVNAVIDVFFTKEVLAQSCAKGLKKGKKKDSTVALCPPIVVAIIGKVRARYVPPPTVGMVTGKINQKCVEARRPKRGRIISQK